MEAYHAAIKAGIVADCLAFLSTFFSNFYNADLLRGKNISDQALQSSWNIGASASPKACLDCVSAWPTDFRKDLARIDVPTFVIHGDSDRILPIDSTGKITHGLVPRSRFVVIEGAPHGLDWTHTKQVNSGLLGFLEENS